MHGKESEAFDLFLRMQFGEERPNQYTMGSILRCSTTGFEASKLVDNALVDMYAKQVKLDCAFQVFKFNHKTNKDVVFWKGVACILH
ncbi:hypothetical protein V6N13_086921 [Hibiscus sabdariffa]